ncbi:hypothetical protein T439DRAFT_76723 [Meredithblackwellia eburnea MCA 4105]
MFGEETSESPRLPSPWRTLGRSSLESPSPLSLRTPASSSPSTPPLDLKHTPAPPAAAARSDHLELDFEFDVLTFKDEQDSPTSTSGGVGEEDGRKAISHRRGSGLDPEVDKSGHIEYKLRLNTPTPIRLAKLQTQLKWRLVEGGGMALYELGVLDDGTLVGLSFEDMTESLETLGKMLEGLGGGEIKNQNRHHPLSLTLSSKTTIEHRRKGRLSSGKRGMREDCERRAGSAVGVAVGAFPLLPKAAELPPPQ